jgi:hypothetical protein
MDNGQVGPRHDGNHYKRFADLLKRTGLMDEIKNMNHAFMFDKYGLFPPQAEALKLSPDDERERNTYLVNWLADKDLAVREKRFLEKGEFYLGVVNGNLNHHGTQGLRIFYVNPADWTDEDEVGLIYLGVEGIVRLSQLGKGTFTRADVEENAKTPRGAEMRGFNTTVADAGMFKELGGRRYFSDEENIHFHHIPLPTGRFGLLNWEW